MNLKWNNTKARKLPKTGPATEFPAKPGPKPMSTGEILEALAAWQKKLRLTREAEKMIKDIQDQGKE